MGNRTNVEVTVLGAHVIQTKKILEASEGEAQDEWTSKAGTVTFQFYGVNYGTISCLGELVTVGIAFESKWESDGVFGSGTDICRYTPEGECIRKQVYDRDINPDLESLMKYIDSSNSLRELIVQHHAKVTSLPWDNQEKYGKLYRVKQLISPTETLIQIV